MGPLELLFLLLLSYYVLKIIKYVWYTFRCYILPSFGYTVDLKKFGQWAVVTGATDGIGKAYTEELAQVGFNIVLISRNENKLQDCSSKLREKYGVKTKEIIFDFSNVIGYDMIRSEIHGLDIGILVNNVGMSGKFFQFFDKLDIEDINNVTITNVFGDINMTRLVLPDMLSRKRGVIVHISSGFGYFPSSLSNVYPHTKALINSFAKALQVEDEKEINVHHQLLTPCFVSTNLTRNMKTSLFVPSASDYVRSAVRTIGITDNTFGYWSHEIFGLILQSFPFKIIERVFFSAARKKRLNRKSI